MSGLIDLASLDDAALAAIGSGQSLTRTAVKTGAYTASSGDLIPVDTTAGNVTVTLPTAPADKAKVTVKHIIQGGTNTVSVACGGSDVLNKTGGNTTATLTLVNQGATYEYQAATHIWTVTAGDLPLSGLDLRYVTPTAAAAAYAQKSLLTATRPVVGAYQVTQAASNGTDTGVNTMVKHDLPAGVSAQVLRLRFSNTACGSNGDIDTANAVTVNASVGLTATGPWFPVAARGARTITIDAGEFIETDPIALKVAAGGTFYTKTFLSVTSGQTWSQQTPAGAIGASYWCSQSNGESNLSASTAAFTATSGNRPWGPVSVLVEGLSASTASVLAVGDSIVGAVGDLTAPAIGFVVRALAGVLPYQRLAVSGSKVQNIVDANTGRRRLVLARGCNVAVAMYGTNDIFTSTRTLAQVQADLLSLWTILSGMGMKVYGCTLIPQTTSTDSWATTANQTIKTGETVRTSFNDWVRAGAPIDSSTKAAVAVGTGGALLAGATGHPLTGYFETADVAESARNSGFWKVTGAANYATADGTHPTTAMHILMSAAVIPATLTAAVA